MDIKSYISSGILELYVLGQLSAEENAEVEVLAQKYQEIQQEIFEISKSLEAFSKIHSIPVEPSIKEVIFKNLPKKPKPTPTQNLDTSTVNTKINFRNLAAWIMGSILLLSTAILYLNQQKLNEHNQSLQNSLDECETLRQEEVEKSNLYAKITNPNAQVFELNSTPSFVNSKLLIYYNTKEKSNTLQWINAPKLEAGKVYQLWYFADDGIPQPLETLTSEKNIWEITYQEDAAIYAFTIEPQGGSTVPTMENLIGTISLQ